MPRVFDLIKPLDSRDTYAITDVVFQKGGLREVENIQAMYTISEERRTKGMIAFVIETGEFYTLGNDLTNDSWQKIDFSESVNNDIAITELNIKEDTNSFSNLSGENLSILVTDTSVLKIKNGISISSLIDQNQKDGKILFLQNISNNNITVKNNYFNNSNSFENLVNNKNGLKKIATDGEVIIAVSSDGFLIKSLDGETWSNIPDIDTNTWQSIKYYNNNFIAISSTGNSQLIFSTDKGLTWTKVALTNNNWQDITYKSNLYAIISDSKLIYSSDLIEWLSIDIPTNNWREIAYGNQTFVAVGDIIDNSNAIIYSKDDGVTWQITSKPNSNALKKIKFINNKFYAISDYEIITSNDGVIWNLFSLPFDANNINDLVYYNNYYVFIKKNKAHYTHNFDYWQEFSFINDNYVNSVVNIDRFFYFTTNSEINRLTIDVVANYNFEILTGTNFDVTLLKNASILLQFSTYDNVWRILGGLALNPNFLDLFDVPQTYPQVEINNNLFLSVNPNQSEEEKIIFNNPFPVIEDENLDLVINNINGLKIRKFDSQTGKIIFANRFIPTYNFSINQIINFDDSINTLTVNVENDPFISNIKLSNLESISYYKNNDNLNLIDVSNTSPILPYTNNSQNWQQEIDFDTISDINPDFFTFPNSFTLKVIFKSTNNQLFNISKTVTQRVPNFDFSIVEITQDFRQQVNTCTLNFIYENITSKENNSSINSIVSNIPNTVFSNFTNGMTTYQASSLGIFSKDITKSNNLVDSVAYSFTVVCRYTRPVIIDSNQNYYQITQVRNLNINFTYPVFTGVTDITKTSVNQIDIMNFTNSGNNIFPRVFNSNNIINVNWWFCVRKAYINNRLPTITLTSNGLSMETSIVYQNDIEIITVGGDEIYTCYAVTLQANINYSINIFFS